MVSGPIITSETRACINVCTSTYISTCTPRSFFLVFLSCIMYCIVPAGPLSHHYEAKHNNRFNVALHTMNRVRPSLILSYILSCYKYWVPMAPSFSTQSASGNMSRHFKGSKSSRLLQRGIDEGYDEVQKMVRAKVAPEQWSYRQYVIYTLLIHDVFFITLHSLSTSSSDMTKCR